MKTNNLGNNEPRVPYHCTIEHDSSSQSVLASQLLYPNLNSTEPNSFQNNWNTNYKPSNWQRNSRDAHFSWKILSLALAQEFTNLVSLDLNQANPISTQTKIRKIYNYRNIQIKEKQIPIEESNPRNRLNPNSLTQRTHRNAV